jgi:hypothetical protein
LRGGNGEVILGVSSNAWVELCNRRGLKPAELKDWMVFWTLVYWRTGKKFNEKSFWDIDNYLLRDDDNKRDKLIERIIKDLEQVEEDFWVEFFDRDNKGNITRIYYNRLNYSSLNDTAVCGCIDSNHQSAPSNFGSGLGFLPYSRNHCHKADACRSSWPISE